MTLELKEEERAELEALVTDRMSELQLAGQFLTAHGVRVALEPVISKDPPAALILDQVRRREPRLVVMGAHGHHPVRDLFLTSVTRAVLKEISVPVFVGA
jgi:nucleotide-binding universal stress UspA family protein